MLKKILIWGAVVIFIVPLVIFVWINIAHGPSGNNSSSSKRQDTSLVTTSTSSAIVSSSTEANQFLEKITSDAFHYGDETLTSGFLVPVASSTPSGFVAVQRIYRLNAYILKFESATGATLPKIEFMGSKKGAKPEQDAITAYSNVVEQVTKKEEKKVLDFIHLDSPGMVLTLTSFGVTYEHLIWNDNGYVVSITASGFPDGVMSPAHLVDILKTMVRN